MTISDVITGAVMVIAALTAGWAVTGAVKTMKATEICLAAGYSGAKVTMMTYTPYCTRRVDQTDIVVLLSEVKNAK